MLKGFRVLALGLKVSGSSPLEGFLQRFLKGQGIGGLGLKFRRVPTVPNPKAPETKHLVSQEP